MDKKTSLKKARKKEGMLDTTQTMLLFGVCILLVVAIGEIFWPDIIQEGFQQLMPIGDNSFLSKFVPRRGDIGPSEEENGYVKDERYFSGYADIQRLGSKQDYCRMVVNKSDPLDMFFACALGGTDGLSSLHYRTKSTRKGFEVSRDDYMKCLDDGRDGYCRIIKVDDYTFEARCNEANDIVFRDKLTVDSSPPDDIQLLLRAYEGIIFWLRLRDDMVDYAKNLVIMTAGSANVDEYPPLRGKEGGARTLELNGVDQYLRIGDNKSLEFGNKIELRYLRAVSFWIYFEEFTNNAHIFDFGNGSGKDNVWCGIIGRGNSSTDQDPIRSLVCGPIESTIPDAPSGQQPTLSMSPQELMETTSANVNDFTCPKPEIYGRIMKPIQPMSEPPHTANTADLVYEIWDRQQRKMHIQIKNIIPLREWVHITITARNTDAFRPDLEFYRNGELVHVEKGAWLPQSNFTTKNYIGKSNWMDVTTPYENADELFKGKIFDFRGYRTPMAQKKVEETYKWGKELLGV